MSDDNVVDIFDWINANEMPTGESEHIELAEENDLSPEDVSSFLHVLRHIQSMSVSHSVDINIRTNELRITINNDVSNGKLNESIDTSTGLSYTTKIEAFLPILDGLIDDEEETILLVDSMVESTIEGINSLHVAGE